MAITHALIIDDAVVRKGRGASLFHVHRKATAIRGPIALFGRQSGCLIATADIAEVQGPLSADEWRSVVNEVDVLERLTASASASDGHCFVWVLEGVRPLQSPGPCRRHPGALVWVLLRSAERTALRECQTEACLEVPSDRTAQQVNSVPDDAPPRPDANAKDRPSWPIDPSLPTSVPNDPSVPPVPPEERIAAGVEVQASEGGLPVAAETRPADAGDTHAYQGSATAVGLPPQPADAAGAGFQASAQPGPGKDFLVALRKVLRDRGLRFAGRVDVGKSVQRFGLVDPLHELSLWFRPDERVLGIDLVLLPPQDPRLNEEERMSNVRGRFRRMMGMRKTIERDLCEKLQWIEDPNSTERRVRTVLTEVNIRKTEDWDRHHAWIADTLESIDMVFMPIIRRTYGP